MKKDDIKTLIVIVIICTLITVLVLLLNRKSNVEKMEIVTDYNTFFSVSNCVNDYINYLTKEDSEAIYNLLSSDYVGTEDTGITSTYPENSSAVIDSIKEIKLNSRQIIYYVTGKIIQNNFDETSVIDNDFSIIVLIDYNNITYSIIPVDNYKKIVNKIKKINIEKNEFNNLKKTNLVSKEQICVLYMSDYIDKINNDINSAYELLTVKMKEKYPTIDSYQTYINNNKDKFTTVADKCRVTEGKDNTRTYYVVDGNENEYTFYEDGIMNYTVDYYLK